MAQTNIYTGPGRPTAITADVLAKLRAAFLMDCNEEEACAYAKIDPATLWRYKQRHPEYCKEIEACRLNPFLKAKAAIYKNLDNPKVAQWWLERKAKDEFSTKQIIEDTRDTREGETLDKVSAAVDKLAEYAKSDNPQSS